MNYYKLPGEIGANLHIREGNRGGRALFDWEDVRAKRFVEREVYLGASSKIGVLDKGGVFRKGDWWNNSKQKTDNKEGFKKAKEAEKKRFQKAFNTEKVQQSERRILSKQEIDELMQKASKKDGEENAEWGGGVGVRRKLTETDGKRHKRQRSRQHEN